MLYRFCISGSNTPTPFLFDRYLCDEKKESQLPDHDIFKELIEVQDLLEDSRKTRGLLFGSLIPISTSSGIKTLQSVFTPTTSFALKVNKSALKVLGAMIWDILTLGIRIITLIPRTFYNAYQRSNSPIFYIFQEGIKKTDLASQKSFAQFMADNDSFDIIFYPEEMALNEAELDPVVSDGRFFESLTGDKNNDKSRLGKASLPFLRYNYNLVEVASHSSLNVENISTIWNLVPIFEKDENSYLVCDPDDILPKDDKSYPVNMLNRTTRKFTHVLCTSEKIKNLAENYRIS